MNVCSNNNKTKIRPTWNDERLDHMEGAAKRLHDREGYEIDGISRWGQKVHSHAKEKAEPRLLIPTNRRSSGVSHLGRPLIVGHKASNHDTKDNIQNGQLLRASLHKPDHRSAQRRVRVDDLITDGLACLRLSSHGLDNNLGRHAEETLGLVLHLPHAILHKQLHKLSSLVAARTILVNKNPLLEEGGNLLLHSLRVL
jgi:hypothetical protein